MIIARDHLIDLAKKETLQRADQGSLLSGYLIGSVAGGEPLLGDTADIDLVLIHQDSQPPWRETVRLSHQIHLDIFHHSSGQYQKPSQLRVHPWMGPALCEPIFLYDPEHFFERAQAGARGQFFRADHTYARALAFLKLARQGLSLISLSERWLRHYLRAVMDAANAVSCLDRFPSAGRRVALDLELQAEKFDYLPLYQGFLQLIGADQRTAWKIPETLADWARAYDTASLTDAHHSLPDYRRDYYLHGFQALVEADQADAIQWPLLQVWERVMAVLPETEDNVIYLRTWNRFLERLGLGDTDKKQRIKALRTYIEQQAAWIESWAKRTGV